MNVLNGNVLLARHSLSYLWWEQAWWNDSLAFTQQPFEVIGTMWYENYGCKTAELFSWLAISFFVVWKVYTSFRLVEKAALVKTAESCMDTVLTGKLLRSSTGSNMKMSKSFKPALTKSNYLSVQLSGQCHQQIFTLLRRKADTIYCCMSAKTIGFIANLSLQTVKKE